MYPTGIGLSLEWLFNYIHLVCFNMNKKEFWIKDLVSSFIEPQNTKSKDIFLLNLYCTKFMLNYNIFLPEVCFYASRWGRCENSYIIWRENALVVPLLYVYEHSNIYDNLRIPFWISTYCYQMEEKLLTLALRCMFNVVPMLKSRHVFNVYCMFRYQKKKINYLMQFQLFSTFI